MKKLKSFRLKLIEDFGTQIVVAAIIAIVTTTISFAWNTNTRLTRLETALISLSSDVHDIKALLEKKGR